MGASGKEVSDKEAFGKVAPLSFCLARGPLPMACLPEAALRASRAGYRLLAIEADAHILDGG